MDAMGSTPDDSRMRRALTGEEPFHRAGAALPFVVRDFWSWSASQLVGNALRGLVAEFLVGRAVNSDLRTRTEWDAVDLVTSEGISIEVKCSGYIQSWAQKRPSQPSFDVAPKRSWDARTNTSSQVPRRAAQLYVFALHHHAERATVDPMDVTQWTFFVVPTARLDAVHPQARRLSLRAVQALAGEPTTFDALASRITAATGDAG